MTSDAVTIASAISSSKAWASKKVMVERSRQETRKAIRNESAKKHKH